MHFFVTSYARSYAASPRTWDTAVVEHGRCVRKPADHRISLELVEQLGLRLLLPRCGRAKVKASDTGFLYCPPS